MADYVAPLKYENSTNGTQDDPVSTEMKATEDTIIVHKELPIHDDETISSSTKPIIRQGVQVDINHDIGLYDRNTGATKLSQMVMSIFKSAASVATKVFKTNYSNQFDVTSTATGEVDIAITPQEVTKFESRKSTNQLLTTSFALITFDSNKHLSSQFTYTSSELTIASAVGTIVIGFDITADVNNSTRSSTYFKLQVDTGSGYTDIPSSQVSAYHRTTSNGVDTATFSTLETPSIGWKYRVVGTGSQANNLYILDVGSNFYAYAITGNVGPAGPQGADGYSGFDYLFNSGVPASSLGVDGDICADTLTGDIYKKESGAWVFKYNNKGAPAAKEFLLWAEENGGIADNQAEWSFGNGATGNIGVVLAYSGKIKAMTFQAESAGNSSANIEIRVNNTTINRSITVPSGSNTYFTVFSTPYSFNAGDSIGFYTILGGSASDVRVCAHIELD